jgi:hypothetical protein
MDFHDFLFLIFSLLLDLTSNSPANRLKIANLDYISSHNRFTDEWWIWKDLLGRGYDPIDIQSGNLPSEAGESHDEPWKHCGFQINITYISYLLLCNGVPAKFRTRYLRNTSQKSYQLELTWSAKCRLFNFHLHGTEFSFVKSLSHQCNLTQILKIELRSISILSTLLRVNRQSGFFSRPLSARIL